MLPGLKGWMVTATHTTNAVMFWIILILFPLSASALSVPPPPSSQPLPPSMDDLWAGAAHFEPWVLRARTQPLPLTLLSSRAQVLDLPRAERRFR